MGFWTGKKPKTFDVCLQSIAGNEAMVGGPKELVVRKQSAEVSRRDAADRVMRPLEPSGSHQALSCCDGVCVTNWKPRTGL